MYSSRFNNLWKFQGFSCLLTKHLVDNQRSVYSKKQTFFNFFGEFRRLLRKIILINFYKNFIVPLKYYAETKTAIQT